MTRPFLILAYIIATWGWLWLLTALFSTYEGPPLIIGATALGILGVGLILGSLRLIFK